MPNDDTNPAVDLAASLAEFEALNTDIPAPEGDDFMSSFADLTEADMSAPGDTPPVSPETTTPTTPDASDPPPVKPTEAAPAKTDDDDHPYPPGKQSPATREHWDKLKAAKQEAVTAKLDLEQRLKAAEAKLAEREAELADLPTLRERAQLADEAERELSISRVESSREFKSAILAPMQAIEEAATKLAEANQIPKDELLDALAERDATKRRVALSNILSGLEEFDKQEIIQMARDTQTVLAKADSMRANASAAKAELDRIQSEKSAKETAAQRQALEAQVTHTVSELRKRVPFIPIKEGETADAVFQQVQEAALKSNIDTPGNRAFATTAAVLLPRVNAQLVKVQEENSKLKARVAELTSVRPTLGAPASPPPAQADDSDDFLDGFSDILGKRSRPVLE